MDFFGSYKSPFGYTSGDNGVDSYGVDHSGFSTQDELQYQTLRTNKEEEMSKNLKQQGFTQENYPQYGNNFWGNSNNNYGFGTSNISKNAENLSKNFNNCYMTFDGQNLGLYSNKRLFGNLDAQSGQDEYQSTKYQDLPDKGPIPEGTYYANQDQRQNITALDAVIGTAAGIFNINHGRWKGGPAAWGTKRVWLQPDAKTNTYGRSGFSIHGGWNKGSAGCIDIPWQTGKLSNYLDDCQESVPVYVKYPKNW